MVNGYHPRVPAGHRRLLPKREGFDSISLTWSSFLGGHHGWLRLVLEFLVELGMGGPVNAPSSLKCSCNALSLRTAFSKSNSHFLSIFGVNGAYGLFTPFHPGRSFILQVARVAFFGELKVLSYVNKPGSFHRFPRLFKGLTGFAMELPVVAAGAWHDSHPTPVGNLSGSSIVYPPSLPHPSTWQPIQSLSLV